MLRLALVASALIASVPATSSAAPAPWTCDGDYRALAAVNGPGIYRFRPAAKMSIRYLSEGNGTFSVSTRSGTTCTITCLHTNVPYGSLRECTVPANADIVVTLTSGDAVAISENPTNQPLGGVPMPGPLPNDPVLTDPGCSTCSTRTIRASDSTVPGGLHGALRVRGQHSRGRYVLTITAGGQQAVPPLSIEDDGALPPVDLMLLPQDAGYDVTVTARYHKDASRCLVAVGDPAACGPAGPLRIPREDPRWREAGVVIAVTDGPSLFVPYLGQLCATASC